jgi:AraC-like DNA-binding protein
LCLDVIALASDAGMSVPSYHARSKALTGNSRMRYVKAMRLREARLMLSRQDRTVAEVALSVAYVSPARFSLDFKRRFHRTTREEAKWVRQHLGA